MSVFILPEKLNGIGEAVFIVSHPMIATRIGLFAPSVSEEDAISLPDNIVDDIDYVQTINMINIIEPKVVDVHDVNEITFFLMEDRDFPDVKNPQKLSRSIEHFPYSSHYYIDFVALKDGVNSSEFANKFTKFVYELLANDTWANAFFFTNYIGLSEKEKERHERALKSYEELFKEGV